MVWFVRLHCAVLIVLCISCFVLFVIVILFCVCCMVVMAHGLLLACGFVAFGSLLLVLQIWLAVGACVRLARFELVSL